MGRGMALALLLGFVSSDAGAAAAQAALNQAAGLALLGYSRDQERAADQAALRALVAAYGHTGGATALFAHLGEAEQEGPLPALSTHPLTADRRQAIESQAREAGWPTTGTLTPLPAVLVAAPAKAD
jgi:predicted Zn-dependent protease